MKSFIIKNGKLLSPVNGYRGQPADILVKEGVIVKVAEHIESEEETIDASGCIVTPGFIDIHTHCYPRAFLGMEPDVLGIKRGSTTILDAGSSGADNYEHFRTEYINKAKTKVYTLLNVSKEGLERGHELDAREKVDISKLKKIVNMYPDNIVGLKARASASVVGEMGLEPIRIAAETAKEINLPLTVHVGNYPPALADVLDLLAKKDLVTHAFHGKKGGILTADGHIIPAAQKARERGVMFDIGHGEASFSFEVFKQALAERFDCDMISTDLHAKNYNGPVFSLTAVVNKVMNCGESLEDIITKCTSVPAKHYGLQGLGELAEGYTADFNLFTIQDCREEVVDSIGDTLTLERKLTLKKTIYSRGGASEVYTHITGRE